MLSADLIAQRQAEIAQSPDLARLLDQLTRRAQPIITDPPPVPLRKALLSRDGGVCPHDGATLTFNPQSPNRHRCPTCGESFSGDRHDRHWAKSQHLWLAERAAHLATVGTLGSERQAIDAARTIVLAYPEPYFELPNQDNVLGPSHLFFSTYLESIWILNYLAAAFTLREADALDERDLDRISALVDEAGNLIGEFNEGMSNRQTWNAAALTAIAVWFEDEALAQTAIEGRTGLLGHLTDGFGADGLWFEGENYHLFAMQGLLTGLGWARLAGVDYPADPELSQLLGNALLGPTRSALPDGTFPARKDARFGLSLAHPAYLECWETGYAWLPEYRDQLGAWLSFLYQLPPPEVPARSYDAYLHEAGETAPSRHTRADLSWWALATMDPEPSPAPDSGWHAPSIFFPSQGLAVLRHEERYVSLDTTSTAGGHGHEDRLHLTVHAHGVHWLADPGAGSYVTRDLFWYRSARAHNVPTIDGVSPDGTGQPEAFAAKSEGQGWIRSRSGPITRTLVTGPTWLVDIVEVAAGTEGGHLETNWHLAGQMNTDAISGWTAAELTSEFETDLAVASHSGGVTLGAEVDGRRLTLHLVDAGELVRATGPGLPHQEPRQFVTRQTPIDRNGSRQVTVLDFASTDAARRVKEVRIGGEGVIRLTLENGSTEGVQLEGGRTAQVTTEAGSVELGGTLPVHPTRTPLFETRPPWETHGSAIAVLDPPVADGTPLGFEVDDPLTLDDEHQYRRSEEPWDGAGQFRAEAYVNYDADALYLCALVFKPDLVVRHPDDAPLDLDNEPDDIHVDGVQLYYQVEEREPQGFLIALADGGTTKVHRVSGTAGDPAAVNARWTPLPDADETGYCLTVKILETAIDQLPPATRIRFDLLVNEARSDRTRRAGQLVWSGAGGWVYLRGDRHSVSEYGWLQLT